MDVVDYDSGQLPLLLCLLFAPCLIAFLKFLEDMGIMEKNCMIIYLVFYLEFVAWVERFVEPLPYICELKLWAISLLEVLGLFLLGVPLQRL